MDKLKLILTGFILFICFHCLAQQSHFTNKTQRKLDSIVAISKGINIIQLGHIDFKKKFGSLSNSKSTASRTADLCGYFCNQTVLPVKGLVLFGKRTTSSMVSLQWETLAEINSKYFQLDRGYSVAGPFETVALVNASGNTSTKTKYARFDANDYAGISYYRVKELDIDSNFAYSNIVAIDGYDSDASLKIVSNPGTNATIGFSVKGMQKSKNGNILILDALGRTIFMQQHVLIENRTYSLNSFKYLTPGMYTVVFQNEINTLRGSFVIIE